MPGGPVATSPARRARGLFPSGLHFLKQQSRLTGVGKQRQSLPWSLPWLPRTPDPPRPRLAAAPSLGLSCLACPACPANCHRACAQLYLASCPPPTAPRPTLLASLPNPRFCYRRRSFPLPINNCRTGENRTIRNRPLRKYHSAKKEDLIPLCIEDELKNPKAKIIDISTTKGGTSHMEQSETHPMIFHDSRHIRALLLTRNRFSSHFKEREHFYQYRRTNFVLERNCAILKSLIREPSVPVCKPQSSLSTAEKGAIKAIATEMIHRAVHDKPKMQISSQTTTIKPWSKFHNLSQTFSNLTKKFVGYFDKTFIHEGSAGSGKIEEIASTMRPISSPKIYTSSIKCYPKHVKNVLAVHRIDNLSPLDDFLTSSRKI
ncbi:PREDICTED: uncharacterized protein C1orf141 homolog [Dipodomys ordii]|uniref:Uncharacterized protein C1orf141 homolog n=1 Tax=Dipodomys ordii TaxID=10020 RepID=A0A1S3FIU4_DIPOR|nr:PREDICTED: uncharacterized protein C1orf141 homolog [Dipodomys ordii]